MDLDLMDLASDDDEPQYIIDAAKAAESELLLEKSTIFKERELRKFISTATDSEWLDVKFPVAGCIFGIFGTTRSHELIRITINDVQKHGQLLLVQIRGTKTYDARSFTITGEFVDIVERYQALRPPHTVNPRFFVNYRAGKCTNQVIGKNKLAKMPQRIATYLELKEPNRYTGHSFRRSSASTVANSGASMDRLQRAGGWRSSKVAEGYVEQSIQYKKKTGQIVQEIVSSQGYVENACDDDDIFDDLSKIPDGAETNVKEGNTSSSGVEGTLVDITNGNLMQLQHVDDFMKATSFSNFEVTFQMK